MDRVIHRRLYRKVNVLNTQSAGVRESLVAAQAVETEQARIAAEAEAKRVAAEAAEQARLAAEAEAQRVAAEAAEQARLAAEAEAQRVAAEAEAKRIADEAEAKRVADEQARVAAEAEAQRVAQQQAARQAVFRTAGTLAMPANAAAITVSGQGLIQVGEGAAALAQAIADAIAALGRIAAAGPGAYIAAFVSLGLYSPATADGSQDRTPDRIRYGFGLKAEQLGLPPGTDLQSIALAQGTVELPWRLSNEAKGN